MSTKLIFEERVIRWELNEKDIVLGDTKGLGRVSKLVSLIPAMKCQL